MKFLLLLSLICCFLSTLFISINAHAFPNDLLSNTNNNGLPGNLNNPIVSSTSADITTSSILSSSITTPALVPSLNPTSSPTLIPTSPPPTSDVLSTPTAVSGSKTINNKPLIPNTRSKSSKLATSTLDLTSFVTTSPTIVVTSTKYSTKSPTSQTDNNSSNATGFGYCMNYWLVLGLIYLLNF